MKGRGDGLQIRKAPANILNKQIRKQKIGGIPC